MNTSNNVNTPDNINEMNDIDKVTFEQAQSAQINQSAQTNNAQNKNGTPLVQGKLSLDESTIELLSKYYQGDRLNMIKRQMSAIINLINVNVNRYNYSKDYKDAVDHTIALITAGKFL